MKVSLLIFPVQKRVLIDEATKFYISKSHILHGKLAY